jgi:acyl-CoA thioester hydrolase
VNSTRVDGDPATPTEYPVTREISTRWCDVDGLGHVNTSVYIQLFDTAINGWLITECGYDPHLASAICVVAHYDVDYHREVHFPEVLTVGLRVQSVGRTSVTYDVALFGAPDCDGKVPLAARARCVHVYIDRISRRAVPVPASVHSLLPAEP